MLVCSNKQKASAKIYLRMSNICLSMSVEEGWDLKIILKKTPFLERCVWMCLPNYGFNRKSHHVCSINSELMPTSGNKANKAKPSSAPQRPLFKMALARNLLKPSCHQCVNPRIKVVQDPPSATATTLQVKRRKRRMGRKKQRQMHYGHLTMSWLLAS